MKNKNNLISLRIVFKGALVVLLLGVSLTSRSQQIMTTFAGSAGHQGYSGDGGPATAADLNQPGGVALDAFGNVFIATSVSDVIRKVSSSGTISTYAGIYNEGGYLGDGGPATATELHAPYAVATDAAGNVYIADFDNYRIRMVNTSGTISTFAGTGKQGFSGNGGPATAADLSNPEGVAVDSYNNVYIADEGNDRIREVNTSGIISTFAGSGSLGYSGNGGPATAADLSYPQGVSVDSHDNVYIPDDLDPAIRVVNTSGIITTIAGNGTIGYTGDGGPATAAELDGPYAAVADAAGNVYITQRNGTSPAGNRIRIVNTSGIITTFAGNGYTGSIGDGGIATAAELSAPWGISVDATGSLYIADANNNRVQKVVVSPLAVSGSVTAYVSCNGGSNGSALASPSGGVVPFTYSWSPGGSTTSIATGLSAATYTITVTSFTGVTATSSVVITQPNAVTTGASILSNACNGTSNGNATAVPSGGKSPYTYSWSNGITSNPTGAALSAGIYSVTVTDNCGNSATASVTIKQSTAIIPTAVTAANVSCYGGSSGQVKVSVSGGTAPYAYSWSPSTSSTYIAPSLSAGTYTVTVVDNNGCNASSSTTITQPTLLKDSVSTITYPQCGGETASATIGVSGGTSPYRYTWSPNVSSTSTATGLIVRSYVVQVKDNNGCYNNLSFSITQPPIPVMRDSIVKSATVNVLCSGGSNGSATVGVKYGTTPYTYSWSTGGGTNATINGLSAGTYSVTVNDAGGCTVTASVSVGQPVALSSVTAFVAGNVNCNGGSNGQAKVSVSGGSIPYTYSWSPNTSSTYIASGLSAGTYTVTVMDNCGASINSSAVITQPVALRDSAIISYPLCSGGTGSATIGVTGGTTPYNYTWSPNVSTTASATGLTVRGYVVQVKDNNGCYNDINFSLTQPATLRDSIVKSATVNISCNGASAGSATAGVKYGTTPYTYSWSPAGGNSATAIGLSGGTYTVTVSDGGGCTVTASVNITQPAALSPTAFIGAGITCNGASNGTAKVSVSGGSIPYTYSWLSPASGSTYIASGLSAGTYTVTVSDNCGASASSSVTVTEPAILSDSVITSSVVSPPCSGGGTGSAAIGVTGGTSPYRYTWSPNVSTTDSASGLTVRGYVVQVKDKNGCYNNITFNVTCSSASETVTYNKENGASCCPSSDNINLYPNPNTGQFTLSGLQTGMILEMYDYTGKLISAMTTTNESMQLNILNQANGIYLIRILDKDGNLVSEKKVVKTQ